MNALNEHPRGALHAHLDSELSLEGSLEVEHHLSDCASCRRELDTYRALRQLLQSAKATTSEAELTLLRVTRTAHLRHRQRKFLVMGGAMAAAALLALVPIPGRTSGIANEVASAHARAMEAGRTEELASKDPAAVERWLSTQSLEPVPPTEGGNGIALRGARVESLGGRRVATVVYQVGSHVVDVFAWRSAEADVEPRPTVAGHWTVCRWAHRGVAYWMVSDMGTEELEVLAGLIRNRRT